MADSGFNSEAEDQLQLENLQAGTPVTDSEGQPLGTLVRVYHNADYGVPPPAAAPKVIEPYLEIQGQGGMLWVPLGQVMELRPDVIRLNVLRDRLHEMAFDQKPSLLQG